MAGDPGVHGGSEPPHAGQAKERRESAPAVQVAQDLGNGRVAGETRPSGSTR